VIHQWTPRNSGWQESAAEIRAANKVVYCVADPVTERRTHHLNPNAESLCNLYGNDKPRIETYRYSGRPLLADLRRPQESSSQSLL